ncbi:ultraviolet-B receptor UVR8 isoform X5 [Ricinus communis]|uniref:ultraviolet-B receptor UVR8 isoform X5 n=1 Tax=Ricinus communis TaxID=3988 RepID=UPI0007728189|nr:ultraviolet-B receptor UVR8 isoform X5 [Ricinus communis]|eukprot:XP_015572631.1 ultraviolet-B receptor UVR8 isoform X5 [Ricinus communis]
MWSTQMRRYTRMKSYRRWMSSEAGKRYAAVWGNGDFGRLGTGSLDSQWRPKLLLSSCFANHSLKSIACGGAHTLFLTETGCVYATGLNDFGQLGISGNLSYTTEPVKVSGLQKEIMQISAGYHHSCAITVDGELYMWGRNSNGQLGLGKKAQRIVPLPTKVEYLNGLTIKLVALGSEHSIAVTDRGEALSWGLGGFGRLGHSNQSGTFSEYTPRSIKKLEEVKVKSVAAGLLHSACIDGGGELYAWGVNENGCLGIGSFNSLHAPERVQGPFLRSPVEKVSCGWRHTAAISEGNIYTWGWGGSNGTFSEDGHSSGGQLGHGSDVDYLNPKSIIFENNVKVLQVSCGFNHTGAILENAKS